MSSRSRWSDLDLAAAIDGTLAPLVKSVLAETCACAVGSGIDPRRAGTHVCKECGSGQVLQTLR